MSSGKPQPTHINYSGFPLLTPENHRKTSEDDPGYNCLAFAAGYNDRLWWPSPDGMWPICWRVETIECFICAYEFIGYEKCNTPDLEPGYLKIAIYATPDKSPQHAALQLPSGKWTSKMGVDGEDIEHDWGVLDGPAYGSVAQIMRRTIDHPSAHDPAAWTAWHLLTAQVPRMSSADTPAP